ncbi:MAG TPA: hypothetical protein VEJ42_00905 [Streptosporangiaceae bacterium]|nr:hypothetical protein [Streptosporangiaceae bacterium]
MYVYPGRRGPVKTLASTGGVLAAAGVLLYVVPLDYGTIPQWNSLCSSGIGQLGQLLDNGARQDCGVVGLADHLIGVLIGVGAACLIAAFVLAIRGQSSPPPPAPGFAGPPPWPAAYQGPPPEEQPEPITAELPALHDPVRGPGWQPWLRRYRTAAVIAAVAVIIAAAGAAAVVSASAGSGRLLSFLCWNGPSGNSATLLQWPSGRTVAGTYRTADISGTAPDQQVSNDSGALTGTVAGSSASLDFAGGQQLFGTLGTDLVLSVPQSDGSLQPVACKPGTAEEWNAALADLSQQVGNANSAAQAQQQQQNISNQIAQAEQQLASDVTTLTQDATTLENETTLAGDIQQMQNDYATEQADYQTELNDTCPGKGGDAGVVGGDAGVVSGDLSTLQGDISSLQGNDVSSDIAAVQSDASTITSLGGTPDPDPSAAIAEGNQALQDLSTAISSATSNGNAINTEAQQLASQAQAAANC